MVTRTEHDIDKGYAWIILAGCHVMYLLVAGLVKSFGILYTEIVEHYDVGSGPVSVISSLILGLMFGLGPFANYLALKTSFRITTFVGGLLLGIGYSASYFVTTLEFLCLTLGVTAGLGVGLSTAPCSTIISFYFEKRRALANGITVAGSGIGAIAFSFLYKYLIETYALKQALLILGGVLLNVCVAAACFRQPQSLVLEQKRMKKRHKQNILLNGVNSVETHRNKENCSCGPDFRVSLLKNPRFTLYMIVFVICISGFGNNVILIPSQIKYLGFDKTSMSVAIAIMGGCEIAARILTGWVADKKWIKPKHIFSIFYFISSVFAFIAPHMESLNYMYVYSAIIGTFPASFWSLASVLIIDVVGMKDFPAAYGLIFPGLAASLLIWQTCIGWLRDKTGDWKLSFYSTGVLLLLPAVLMSLEPLIIPQKYFKRAETVHSDDDETERQASERNKAEKRLKENIALLVEDIDSLVPSRQSKIYEAYSRDDVENNKKDSLYSDSAPLATVENI